jgi:Phosphoglycerate dehydrogenase and related dehydrogenases
MKQYILSTRPFRNEFIQQMLTIDANYEFVTPEHLPEDFKWQQVLVTIGWSKDWEEHLLTKDSSLQWVQSISAGVDTLPLEKFEQFGIKLTNARGIHAQSITDHLLAILFMRSRGIFDAINNQHKHQWEKAVPIQNIQDWRILIVGTGKIGQQLAKCLQFFGVETIGINTNGRQLDYFNETYPLIDLAYQSQQADIVINALPLTEDTYHLYDQTYFKLMKKSATFINIGRGPSVDTEALYQALKEQTIAFAALDVFEEEPLNENHPLWEMDNCLITPHLSGYTPHFQKAFMQIFLENLSSFTTKQTLSRNLVSLTSGY